MTKIKTPDFLPPDKNEIDMRIEETQMEIKLMGNLPKHIQELKTFEEKKEWIISCIKYEEHKGVHTYSPCSYCDKFSRSGRCVECWRKTLRILRDANLKQGVKDEN